MTAAAMMTADDVEARLIEAVRVFDRLEAAGGAGWATDGPWWLSLRASHREAVVNALELGEAVETAIFSPRPDRDMVTRAEEAFNWLMALDEPARLLVLAGVRALALGHSRVPWTRLLMRPDVWRDPAARGVVTARGLALRYCAALEAMAKALRRVHLVAGARADLCGVDSVNALKVSL